MRRQVSGLVLVLGLGLVATAILGDSPFFACTPPVSDEATVTLSGRVLLPDGSPAAGVEVNLQKTDLDVLDAEWVAAAIVNADAVPFKTMTTGDDGGFLFEFGGEEANAKNQKWAAYFIVWALSPTDPEGHMALATDSFQFSNQELDQDLGELRFWDMPEASVTVGEYEVTFTWEDSDLPPADGAYFLHVDQTEWTAEVEGKTYTLPLTALEPCSVPVKDDPAECQARTEHRVHVVSLADGVRYRTAWHKFTATNPKGLGVRYRNDDDGTSGRTCSGKNLFDLNDGKFSGDNAVQLVGGGITADDLRCLQFDLGAPTLVGEIYVHNGLVVNHKKATIEFAISPDETTTDNSWTVLGTWSGDANRFWNMNHRVAFSETDARWLRIRFVDDNGTPTFAALGEVTLIPFPSAE